MKIICFPLVFFISFYQPLAAQVQCEKDFVKTTFAIEDREINVLLIWFPIKVGAQSTLRLCSEITGMPLQRHCGYDRSNNKTGIWEAINNRATLIQCSSIPNLCKEEPFEHSYIMKGNKTEFFTNKWKTTKMMERGDLQEPCLVNGGIPLTRHCVYNRFRRAAEWELLSPNMRNVSCHRDENLITYDLNALYKQVKNDSAENRVEAKQAARNLTDLLVASQSVRVVADIKISADILKIITENDANPNLITDVLNVTDIIMAENKTIITDSEKDNVSSNILKTIDNYFHKIAKIVVPTNQCDNINDGIVYNVVNLTSVFYVNPYCSNITGLAIYKTKTHDKQQLDHNTGYYYDFLFMNRTLDYIIRAPDLLLASYFPLSLWDNMKNYLCSINNHTVLTFILFKNDLIFINRTETKGRPRENILEIKISNYDGPLPEDVPFIYGFNKSYLDYTGKPTCGFWNTNNWSTVNITTEYDTIKNNELLICHSMHLTHFGAIFGLSFNEQILNRLSHNLMMEYISIIGCGLSLLGLSSIWLTAVCFKSFRINPSNKVLLNMSFVLTLLMAFFILSNLPDGWNPFSDESSDILCKMTGAFLHYIVAVLFFWMLIIAILQYLRYVKVIGYVMPTNFMLKFSVVAWGLPLISVIYVALMDGYTIRMEIGNKLTNICYPTGNILKYGVILPTATVLAVNLLVFVCIFYSLHRSLVQFEHHARKYIKYQVRISVLLFFLLGISWLFGIMAFVHQSAVFAYIFCLLSTLQGFVLFLFFIIFDEQTRLSWVIFCCAKSYRTREGKDLPKYMNMKSRSNL